MSTQDELTALREHAKAQKEEIARLERRVIDLRHELGNREQVILFLRQKKPPPPPAPIIPAHTPLF